MLVTETVIHSSAAGYPEVDFGLGGPFGRRVRPLARQGASFHKMTLP